MCQESVARRAEMRFQVCQCPEDGSLSERTSNSQSSVFPENENRVERCRIKERSRIERRESRRIVDEMEEKRKERKKRRSRARN